MHRHRAHIESIVAIEKGFKSNRSLRLNQATANDKMKYGVNIRHSFTVLDEDVPPVHKIRV